MASYKNFSIQSRLEKDGLLEDYDSPYTHDPIKVESVNNINIDEWVKFISYYRYHIDEFATDILGIKLATFQRILLRAMARHRFTMLICCRGIGKSFIAAVFFVCVAILYPGIKLGIVSGQGSQARNVIVNKIEGELVKDYESIKREIQFPINTSPDNCVVNFKNGSEIRAITLGRGDNARGWRFNYLLIDEARLVKEDIIEQVLVPMTKTKRRILIDLHEKYGDILPEEKGKIIYISSAYLKTCGLYKRFLEFYNRMVNGDPEYFVCSLPWQAGVDAGIFYESDILKEKENTSEDNFLMEYEAVFVGSSGDSFYPYELTEPCRVLERVELHQPKNTDCEYVIAHDVAVSNDNKSDNACTVVLKLKQKSDGTYIKEMVYMKTHPRGTSLKQQYEFLRELIHLKFPNTIKLIIDAKGVGKELPNMFYEPWIYTDSSGNAIEYPPLVRDDDELAINNIPNAKPLIRAVSATAIFNDRMYTYMKLCFENKTIRLPISSAEINMFNVVDNLEEAKNKKIERSEVVLRDELAIYVETDRLIAELSNIKQTMTAAGTIVYTEISGATKKDRVSALGYALAFVNELEQQNKMEKHIGSNDALDYIYIN